MASPDPEAHRLDRYRQFCDRYGIGAYEEVTRLYDIDDLERFLPAQPSSLEKLALSELIGVTGLKAGYMDYQKSQHTFELIMQWQERTSNHGLNAIRFRSEDGPQP